MSTLALPAPRFRTLLDCFLVLLLILVISAKDQPARGGVEPGGVGTHPYEAVLGEVGTRPYLLDNTTLAAMIAAENAALTLPQYGVNLPVITR